MAFSKQCYLAVLLPQKLMQPMAFWAFPGLFSQCHSVNVYTRPFHSVPMWY